MNRKKLITYLTALIVAFGALAYSSTQTINTLPSSNATFITDLQNFLLNELPQYVQFQGTTDFVYTGGTASTSANLSHNISAVTAFVNGYFVTQALSGKTYTASTRTFVYLRDDTARTVTVAGGVVTYSTHHVYVEMAAGSVQPSTPTGCIPLMQVDTSGAAITAVTDLRTTSRTYLTVRSGGVVAGGVTVFKSEAGVTILHIDALGNVTMSPSFIGTTRVSLFLTQNSALAGASIVGVLSGNSIVGGDVQAGVSGIGYDVTGRAYYADLTSANTILSGNSLYGGRFGNDGATSEVTGFLPYPLKGMHTVFVGTQGQNTGKTIWASVDASATVRGLADGYTSAVSVVGISGATLQYFISFECWKNGTWFITGVSGERYRNK